MLGLLEKIKKKEKVWVREVFLNLPTQTVEEYIEAHRRIFPLIKKTFFEEGLYLKGTPDENFSILKLCYYANGIEGGGVIGIIYNDSPEKFQCFSPEEVSARLGTFSTLHNQLMVIILNPTSEIKSKIERVMEKLP